MKMHNKYFMVTMQLVLMVCITNLVSAEVEQPMEVIKSMHMLVVLSAFQDDDIENLQQPAWAGSIFNGLPGSVSHYFDEISCGQIQVTGEILPNIYVLPNSSEHYVGEREAYAEDLLTLLDTDPDFNFAQYDNDGPDGIPGSSDDDNYVDYLVMMPFSISFDMINKYATGLGVLPISTYRTSDKNSDGKTIKLNSFSGCIASADRLSLAISTICHEYIHSFGANDLYDTEYVKGSNFEIDSAGIGNWGVMGRGLLGWNGDDTPVGPSAFTRMKMNIIGQRNANLIDLYGIHRGLRISDAGLPEGAVYRIWITQKEYFLIEYRRNDNLYCERDNPANGLLIWHVDTIGDNDDEYDKIVDLECPDGQFTDAGFPLGTEPDPFLGGDNLDYWAHNSSYQDDHLGNLGDATDVYDGITYTHFGPYTNPNSYSKSGVYTGIEITNIHPEGDEMVFDVRATPNAGWITAIPPIGLAFQQFTSDQLSAPSASRTLYLLDTGTTGRDILLAVSDDSLIVDHTTTLAETDLQRLIEARIVDGGITAMNAKIIRSNCTTDDIADELASFHMGLADITSSSILGAQKITIASDTATTPEAFALGQNYPNPFNSTTLIPITVPGTTRILLDIYNILGQVVRTIDCGQLAAGQHHIPFEPAGLGSGLYLYRVRGAGQSQSMLYIR